MSMAAFAQASTDAAEPSFLERVMRADGKVAVTIVVVSIILAGMVVYLINTERRVKNLEKELLD